MKPKRSALLNSGMSMIELLVAMVIMIVTIAALINASVVIIRNNLKNQLRNQAIETLANHINDLRTKPFDTITSGEYNATVVVGSATRSFRIIDNITDQGNAKIVRSSIVWNCCGNTYNYTMSTVIVKR